jgi:hypothetical protein
MHAQVPFERTHLADHACIALDIHYECSCRAGLDQIPVTQARPDPHPALRGHVAPRHLPPRGHVGQEGGQATRGRGQACAVFHDEKVHGVKTRRVQYNEIWSFTYGKAKNIEKAKAEPDVVGATWT